jgi:hypothetical protein
MKHAESLAWRMITMTELVRWRIFQHCRWNAAELT